MPIINPGHTKKATQAPPPRRIGLNRYQRPAPLLQTFRNRDTQVSRPANGKGRDAALEMSRGGHIREPESVTAPPESSDDEEDYRLLRQSVRDSLGDSDDDGEGRRANIKPTLFSSTQSSSQQGNTRKSTRERPKPSSQRREVTNSSQGDGPSSSAGSKRSAETPASEMGSHLKDAYGFTNKRKKANTGYGKSSQPRSSQPKSSQMLAPRSSASQRAKHSPKIQFKRYDDSPSPKDTLKGGFIKPEDISPEKLGSLRPFVKPPSLGDSSPCQDNKRPTFRYDSSSGEETPVNPKFKSIKPEESSDMEAETKPRRQPRKIEGKKKSKTKARQSSAKPAKEEFSQRPTFKLHALDDVDFLDKDDNAVTALENIVSDDEPCDISIESPVAVAARCPMCHEVVDAELLAKYSDRGRMNIKKQTEFCRKHKRQTALDSRSQKGYPKINWDTLDMRLKKYQEFIKDILEGTRRSHFREVLKENVESGKNRTLLKTEDNLTPGYYGPRGLRAMTEYIMRTLSSVVRKRAVEDRLVSARGHTVYVQVVLVPELAVRLIMEDMGVTEEDAREIMQDSIEVGELLYEDAGDIVAVASDEEETI